MNASKLSLRVDQLAAALVKLHDVMAQDVAAPLVLDAAIQRFEFTFEVAWKALKAAAETKGVETTTPRDAIKQGFASGWVSREDLWIDLMKARNESSHIYDEKRALDIFTRVKGNLPAFDDLLTALQTYRATVTT